MVTPAAVISVSARSVVSGATPAHRALITRVSKPSLRASSAVARTQWSVASPQMSTCSTSLGAEPVRRVLAVDGTTLEAGVRRLVVALEEDRVEGLGVEVRVERLAVGARPGSAPARCRRSRAPAPSGGRGRCGGPWWPPRRRTPAPGRRRASSGGAARRCRWRPGRPRSPAASRPRRSRSGRRRRSAPASCSEVYRPLMLLPRRAEVHVTREPRDHVRRSSRPTGDHSWVPAAQVEGDVDPGGARLVGEALGCRGAAGRRCRSRGTAGDTPDACRSRANRSFVGDARRRRPGRASSARSGCDAGSAGRGRRQGGGRGVPLGMGEGELEGAVPAHRQSGHEGLLGPVGDAEELVHDPGSSSET